MTIDDVVSLYLSAQLPLLQLCDVHVQSAQHLQIQPVTNAVLDELLQPEALIELVQTCLAIGVDRLSFPGDPVWVEIDCPFLLECWL